MASNSSNGTIPKDSSEYNRYVGVLSFFFLILIFVMSLFGNILVILAFKAVRKLRTVTNFFVVSLAVADILIASFSMPIWGAYLLTGPDWVFSVDLMKMWTCMDIMCGVASIINLTAISIERYLCITFPLSYHTSMTPQKATFIIFGIWLFAFFMSLLKYVLWNWPTPNYELIIVISCFVIPLFTMCMSYRMIFKTARYQARQIALMVNGGVRNFLLASEIRAAKTLAVVMGAFVVSWGPFFVINLVFGFCKSCISVEPIMVTKWMHYSNSVCNPVVYACMNKDFRATFVNILLSGKACIMKIRQQTSTNNGQTDHTDLSINSY